LNAAPPVEALVEHVVTALRTDTFVRLLLSAPADRTAAVQRILGRLVQIKHQPMLSLTLREAKRDTTENIPLEVVPAWLTHQLRGRFRSALLDTTEARWQLTISPKGKARLVAHKPDTQPTTARSHDHAKPHLLDESARPWLTALGLCDESGRVRASMAGKYRQLERYLEILGHLVRQCGWTAGKRVSLADMGCGKGYLTFGAWHLLNRILGLQAAITGVEARPDLVEKTNAIARAIQADSLQFVAGDIASSQFDSLDGLIALHACNTATDHALASGVRLGAKLIVVSPCCHQELRPQLDHPAPLAPLLEHGILEERFSEWLTDGLRALRLQAAGYETKVIEFVASEHTARNLLIVGVRQDRPADSNAINRQIAALKDFFHLVSLASDEIAPR
jgi:SAM-dependent methyltransferase